MIYISVKKAETKKCYTSIEDKGNSISNIVTSRLHYYTPVTKHCNFWVLLFGHVANVFFENGEYKLLWRQKTSQSQNQVSCESLALFSCLKIRVIEKSVPCL